MTIQFRASSEVELVDTQLRLAKVNLTATEQTRITEGYAAAVAAFTRANLIVSKGEFHDKNEGEQWAKLKLEAHRLQSAYEAKLSGLKLEVAQPIRETVAAKVEKEEETRSWTRLTDAEKRTIEKLYEKGYTGNRIATELGRGSTAIYRYLETLTQPKTNGR